MRITYTEEDMEMLRTEIRNLSKERSDLRLVLQVRDKEITQLSKELKMTKKIASHLHKQLLRAEEEKKNSENARKEEAPSATEESSPSAAETAEEPEISDDSNPVETNMELDGEQSEASLDINSEDLKEAVENLSLDDSSVAVAPVDEHETSQNKKEEDQSNKNQTEETTPTPDSAEEIRRRAERMLVWANSATNRNEAMEKQQQNAVIPSTISVSNSSTASTPASVDSKRLYRNVPNDAVQKKKKGPLSGIRRFLEDQMVGDSKEDTYLESDSDSDYYSDEDDDDDISQDSRQHGLSLMVS